MIFVMSLQILNIYSMLMILVYYVQVIIEKICNTMNNNLEELQTWFNVNNLSLSIEETNYMIFSNKKIDKSDIFVKS